MSQHKFIHGECARCGVIRLGHEYAYASTRIGWRKTKRRPACPPRDKVRR